MNLYTKPTGVNTRWVSFENKSGARNQGALENQGAKGHAFDRLPAGASHTLLDYEGSGDIRRIWLTINDRSPEMLRSLRLDMYWDHADTPAVSCPLGDFFGIGLGQRRVFESCLFSDPEGRSFISQVPMPFRTHAKVVLTNESGTDLSHLFYDINLLTDIPHGDDVLYFHTHWRRESPNTLEQDYDILPPIKGSGRFLGCNLGVIADPLYEGAWWGEGEVKVWFGDDEHPTLCGTGTEDYIGTAWGQGAYAQQYEGCPVADGETGQWAFYRYHITDPIYFDDGCRVAIQTIGGSPKDKVQRLLEQKVPLIPVTVDPADQTSPLVHLRDATSPKDINDPTVPEGWCNFWRQDDWSSTAYYYLDQNESALNELPGVASRIQGLKDAGEDAKKRMDG